MFGNYHDEFRKCYRDECLEIIMMNFGNATEMNVEKIDSINSFQIFSSQITQ